MCRQLVGWVDNISIWDKRERKSGVTSWSLKRKLYENLNHYTDDFSHLPGLEVIYVRLKVNSTCWLFRTVNRGHSSPLITLENHQIISEPQNICPELKSLIKNTDIIYFS